MFIYHHYVRDIQAVVSYMYNKCHSDDRDIEKVHGCNIDILLLFHRICILRLIIIAMLTFAMLQNILLIYKYLEGYFTPFHPLDHSQNTKP